MKLDRLHLTAFGRFAGQTVDLGPGLNLIAGPNEAGKSTLQHFIMGMLYGFKRPTQRREYTADLERFRPWQGNDYRGVLTYTLVQGRSFRLERSFDPQREEIRLFDGVTGADLTGTFPVDRRREVRFAEAHLGMTEEVFRSTAWVGQLGLSRLFAGRELVQRVANLQESGREEHSVQAALKSLADQASAIGSARAPTRPYGRLLAQISDRQEAAERAARTRAECLAFEVRLAEVRTELERLEDRAGGPAPGGRLSQIEAELAALRRELEPLAPMAAAGPGVAAEVRTALQLWRSGSDRLDRMREEAAGLQASLTQLEGTIAPLRAAGDWGELVLEQVDAFDRQIAALQREEELNPAGALRVEVTALAERMARLPGRIWLAGAALGTGMAALSPLLAQAAGWGAAVAVAALLLLAGAGCGTVWLGARREERRLRNRVAEAGQRLEAALREGQGRQERLRALEQERSAALARAGAESPVALRAQMLRYGQLGARREEQQGRLADLRTELGRGEAAVSESRREALALIARALNISLDEVLAMADPAALFQRLHARFTSLQERVATLEEEKGRLQAAERSERERLESIRGDLRAEASDLSARLETLLRDLPDTADLDRELAALHEERQAMEAELAALELAQQVLEEVSGEMHRQFAPRLHQAMGEVIRRLTAGRYEQVRIDEEMRLRAIGPADRTIPLDSLSAGTIDQFYLGLRLALLELITEGHEPVPLFLDDPLVQYDDRRAEEAFMWLREVGLQRQVVLFSCHDREARLAQEAGARVIWLEDRLEAN